MITSPIERLREICHSDPVGEKILLVPTYTVGQRLTDSLARSGTAWIGIRSLTLDALALEIVADRLVRDDLSLLSRAQSLAMIESACEDVIGNDDYFGALRHSSGFFRAVQRTIEDLRSSRIGSARLVADSFTNQKKATEIRRVLARYEKLLEQNRFVDRTAIFDLAAGIIGASPRVDRIYSAGLRDLPPIQRDFLEKVAREHMPLQDRVESIRAHAGPRRVIAARGSENEIRGVIRHAVARSIPLDQIEIVHTDRETYVSAILEIANELDVPATFEEGVPIPYTRPGQAILGYLEWLRLEWDATVLRKLISSGVIETKEVGPVLAARIFRNATVGWGRDRHIERTDALVLEYERKLQRARDSVPMSSAVSPADERTVQTLPSGGLEARPPRAERRLRQVRLVRDLVRDLVRLTPRSAEDVSVAGLARNAASFVERFARVASARDGAGKEALLRVLDEVRSLPDRRETLRAAAGRLDELVREISVGSQAPRPGAIHVAPVETGAWGGREHLFVVGLDERFPGGGLQDPVMLDEERGALNRNRPGVDLPLSGARAERTMRDMRAMLDRAATASVTFSFSSEDVLEARETLPCPFLLELWRTIRDRPDASYDEMLRDLSSTREAFVANEPLSVQEEWIRGVQEITRSRGLSGGERMSILRAMESSWPWLSRGRRATAARESREISPWSGKIDVRPDELDPRLTRKPVSASRLEQLARSPFSYFLQYVLAIEPLKELERRPEEWLEAREFGGLFHDVLYRFMTDVIARSELPAIKAHSEELRAVALANLESIADEIPPPSEAAFDVRKRELLEACDLFLYEETKWCENATPRWFEVPFGMKLGDDAGLGSAEEVEVDLGSSGTLLIRGRIDRVDECGENRFAVWDYKSGSAYGYADHQYLSKGTQVQHALYALATRELLSRQGFEGDVIESGYYFPTRKGRARRVRRLPPFSGFEQERFRMVLEGLLDAVRAGSFVHSVDKENCKFCEFTSICGGDVEAITKWTRAMADLSEDEGVIAFMKAAEVE